MYSRFFSTKLLDLVCKGKRKRAHRLAKITTRNVRKARTGGVIEIKEGRTEKRQIIT